MAALILLQIFCIATAVYSDANPGRIPKVYNALITSNQNLEPSKAYPVYQPVLQESFGFPFQPAVFYGGGFQGIYPDPLSIPRGPAVPQPTGTPKDNTINGPESNQPSPKPSDSSTPSTSPQPNEDNKGSPAPPPRTPSPIPLNEFGLPPAVFPLGRFDPTYNGFTQISPFYTYPSLRFYDPYDAYNINPYANLPPLYRPLANVPGPGLTLPPQVASGSSPPATSTAPADGSDSVSAPPPEPDDINVLNYSSKDPAIPNVPPPPLPQGGLKSDKSE